MKIYTRDDLADKGYYFKDSFGNCEVYRKYDQTSEKLLKPKFDDSNKLVELVHKELGITKR